MKRIIFIILVVIILPLYANAEYIVQEVDYEWIQNTGNILSKDPDPNSGWIDISFEFPFFDQTYNQLWISKTGIVCFGEITVYDDNLGNLGQLPSDSVLNFTRPKIAAFWDDLDAGG